MMPIKNGQTSVVLRVKLLDSSSTVGAGLTGLTSASSGLIISTIADNEASATAYTVAGSTIETITTLGTYAAPTATKCRFKEVDSTNHKGIYELQIANARFAVSSAKSLLISILGATNLAQADFVVPLVSDDPYVAKPANFALFALDGSGRVDVGSFGGSAGTFSGGLPAVNTTKVSGTTQTAADLGAAVPYVASGTATAAGSNSLSITFDGDPTGMTFVVDSDEGMENRVADTWDSINGVVTFDPAFVNTPSGTITWKAYPFGARLATSLETDVADIKAKTDDLTFDVADQLNVNIKFVADTQVTGTGTSGDEWGPA